MAAPKRTAKAQSEEGIARFLAVLDAHTKLLAFFFGLCFVAAALALAIWFPQPTPFQYTVFRIVLALAAAGVAGVIPGMIRLKAQPGTALLIHAGGALAVFVMVYLLAPAALTKEQPAPPPFPARPEKPVVSRPLKISNVDAIENGVHIVNLAPPEPVHFARLSNIGDAPVYISLIGFPKQYFYTNLINEDSTLQGHAEKDIYIVLMCNFPDKKEYFFKIEDSAGGTVTIEIRLKGGWNEYLFSQIQQIKNVQDASVGELYHAAKQIVYASGYKKLDADVQEDIAEKLLIAELRRPKTGIEVALKNDDAHEWELLCKLGIDGLKVYLDRHPNGKWADVARNRLISYREKAEEEQAQALYEWRIDISQASSSRTVEQFLQRFPVGSHVPEAKKKMEELRAVGR